MINRRLLQEIDLRLKQQPAAVLLGPRQVAALRPDAVFLDTEDEADRARRALRAVSGRPAKTSAWIAPG